MKLNIEIDMATLGFDQDPETGEMYPTDDLVSRVAEIIASRVTSYDVRAATESEVREVARSKAEAVVEEVLSGPIQRTDHYGNAKGEPTTVRELVMAAADEWMTLPSGNYSSKPTMGDALKKLVDEILRTELKPTVDEAKKKVSEEVLRLAVDGAAAALASARVI